MDIQEELNVELKPINVSLGNLLLDPNNFRLAETLPKYKDEEFIGLQKETREKILKGYGVQDLEKSILSHGWLDVDQIVVRRLRTDPADSSKFVVVEGNRRIAALLNLVSDFNERDFKPPESLTHTSKALRVMLIEGSDDDVDHASEVIMGIRHVGGPRRWGGLQAAMMVVRLVEDKDFSTSQAGKRLGISSIEANRRYRSYKAYVQALEDKDNEYIDSKKVFNLLGEAIRIKSVREWLEWDDTESRFQNERNLSIYYEKIGLNDGNNEAGNVIPDEIERLTNPQDIRELRHIIDHPAACKILEETRSIEEARIEYESDPSQKDHRNLILHCGKVIEALLNRDSLNSEEEEALVNLSNHISKRLEVVK